MSIFGKILKTGFDIVTSPVAVARDVISLGGVLDGEKESYTAKKLRQLREDGEDIRDELDDL